jgi:glycosyltransferase involved in cell wall biosynthesis
MNKNKVTIGVPTYNQSEFIEKTISSILDIRYANLQIIVSDDSLNNETEHKIKDQCVSGNIEYYHNNPRLGRVANYRKLLYELSDGDWYLNLDGDDYFTDTRFLSVAFGLYDTISERDEINIIAFKIFDREIRKRWMGKNDWIILEGKEVLLNWDKLAFEHFSALLKIDSAKKNNFYSCDIISSDWESILRLLPKGKVLFINRTIAHWRNTGSNESQKWDFKERIKNMQFINNAYKELLKDTPKGRLKVQLARMNLIKEQMKGFILNMNSFTKFLLLLKYIFFSIFFPKKVRNLWE